jgi:hypothetical protein
MDLGLTDGVESVVRSRGRTVHRRRGKRQIYLTWWVPGEVVLPARCRMVVCTGSWSSPEWRCGEACCRRG